MPYVAIPAYMVMGQTITLAHLAPFVNVSRQKIAKELEDEFGGTLPTEKLKEVAEKRLRREIAAGVQTIQYQIITLMTTNG